ncbi:MAG: hypothetical protein N3A72_08630 [bacterium]|nr:hypothetical protein [bacterium]
MIEDNVCIGNDYGLQISFSGNYYARNKFSANTTNLSVAAGNTAGTDDNGNISFYYNSFYYNNQLIELQLVGIQLLPINRVCEYPRKQMLRW